MYSVSLDRELVLIEEIARRTTQAYERVP